jgi:beta-galactosidase
MLGIPNSYLLQWKALGLPALTRRLTGFDTARLDAQSVIVRVQSELAGANAEQPIRCELRWTVGGNGHATVEQCVVIPEYFSLIPRIGVQFALAPGLEQVRWFGRGPWENYCDRKHSALVGEYRMTVTDMREKYLCPGECGGREDARWVELTGMDKRGIRAEALHEPLLHFSALHLSLADLAAARHDWELQPRRETFLILDGWHMGVGGDTGWTRNVHPEFLIGPGTYRWGFSLSLLEMDAV